MEFAVVAPLFLLLLAGIIEFGQAFRIEHLLNSASRKGARAAVLKGATTSQVEQKVKKRVVETLGLSESSVTTKVTVNGSAATDVSLAKTGDDISVTVSVPWSKAGIGFFSRIPSTSSLSSNCTFEHE